MASVNRVTILGNVGKDPEIRYMPNGEAIANFSVATSSKWKDKTTGEAREETEWHRIVIYGKLAGIVEKYIKKGSSVYLEGKLKTRKWQDKDGSDRYATEVIVDQMQMLGGKSSEEPPRSSNNTPAAQRVRTQNPPVANGVMDMDDDIPFN